MDNKHAPEHDLKISSVLDELLGPLRTEITSTDLEIIHLLARRQRLVLQVGQLKRKNDLPIRDGVREAKLLEILTKTGEKEGLSKSYVEKLYRVIIEHSVAEEEELEIICK